MKQKMFDKKLSLNKKTIAHLDNGEMKEVYGGGLAPTGTSCTAPNDPSCLCTQRTC